MKKLFALVMVLCCVFSVCCATPPPTRERDVTTVRSMREMHLLLHVDTAFTGSDRVDIEEAARRWRDLSKGRADLRVAFDLDFASALSLRAHVADPQVRLVTSELDIVQRLEAQLARGPGVTILAVKQSREAAGDVVFLIRDRILDSAKFRAVVTHEFGHVLGMPDLAEQGAIMSGSGSPWKPEPEAFTLADVELCRSFLYCD